MIFHFSVPGDKMYEKAYNAAAKRGSKTLKKIILYEPGFAGYFDELKPLRDLYYDTLIRDMQIMEHLGARCDRSE